MKAVALLRVPNYLLHDERLQTPLGLLYLAAFLRGHGVKVVICDLAGEPRERWPDLIPEGFDIYGLSLTTGDMPIGCEVGNLIKQSYPNSLLVAGGAHPSALPLLTLLDGPFDVAVVGPGEEPLLELAMGTEHPQGCYRRNRTAIKGNSRPPRKDLKDLPPPAWDLIPDVISYNLVEKGEPATCVMASMGCTFQCRFCAQPVFGRRYLRRPIQDVICELELLKKEYGITEIRLVDELQMADRGRFIELCESMGRLGLKWRTHTRADLLLRNRDLLGLAYDNGLVELAIGVENPDDSVLKLINKGVTSAQCAEAVQLIRDADIKTKCYFMVGLPGETWETVENTKRWIKEVNPQRCTLSSFAPFPCCDIWLHPERYNYTMLHQYDWRLYFMLGFEGTEAPFVGLPQGMSQEDLIKARQELHEFMVGAGYKEGVAKCRSAFCRR